MCKKEYQRQLTFSGADNNIHLQSFLGAMLNLLLSHNIFQWGMNHLDSLQNIVLVYCIVE